jgi:hypothetical protein
MANALDPNLMTAAERLDEIAQILAAGLKRLQLRQQETTARRPELTQAPRQHPRPQRQRGAA